MQRHQAARAAAAHGRAGRRGSSCHWTATLGPRRRAARWLARDERQRQRDGLMEAIN